MIDVRVRQEHRIERARIERQRLPVALAQPLHALKEAAVDQQPPAAELEEIL